ncbi:hypothetical protein SEPCBS57363_000214 [Sporothrix epigloea]|uniref:rRNA methyltransferase 1, mitochondrial n=1 Tax=Sporothrix epigloea TaxID=1892477 RepID=A0ABP0D3H7_9PEZI
MALSLSRNASNMSAIVRGLRRSFRDPDGKRPPGYNSEVAAHVRERRQEREAAVVPSYRLIRGKKDVTEPFVPKAKTRRARFFDPEDNYGKKSHVYQAKSGALEKEVKSLRNQLRQDLDDRPLDSGQGDAWSSKREDGSRRSERFGRGVQRSTSSSFGRRGEGSFRQGTSSRQGRTGGMRGFETRGRDDAFEKEFEKRFDAGASRTHRTIKEDGEQIDKTKFGKGSGKVFGRGFGQESRQDFSQNFARDFRQPSRQDYKRDYRGSDSDGRDGGRGSRRSETASSSPVPLTIPYTTAASQFLYGRSVVEAALRSARRRLYKLYIYNGANSNSAPQDQQKSRLIERLATRCGITVQQVDERWQRLLDKMSKGRPHNGYVLEASPLPLPPLTALGPLVTGADADGISEIPPLAKVPGFQVELGHQSREELDVNGTSTFVPVDQTMASHHRPLVLLLDQVLDPGNLGAILRSASFLGVSAVAVSKHSSATISSVALKASAGAAEAMALFSVETPAKFLAQSRKAGWKVFTAVPPPEDAGLGISDMQNRTRKPVLDLDGVESSDPLKKDAIILVVGSEGEGLSRAIRREADVEVSIANQSGSNVVDSLNVSVAAGLLCASFLRGATRVGVRSVNKELVADTTGSVAEKNTTQEEGRAQEIAASNELNIF